MKVFKLTQEKLWFGLAIVLLLLSLVYLLKGFYHLTLDKKGAIDLVYRWKEQQYIYQGLYPYDLRKGSPNIDPSIGDIRSGGYPPWAFFTGFFLIPGLSLNFTRFYFAILNLISLVILAIFSYQVGSPYGRAQALFSMSASLALGSHATTLLNGQYGIIINAFLIGMYWMLKKHQNLWTGLFLAIAMVKPNISAPYFFILLMRRQTKAILSFFIYISGASTIIWIITKVDPIYMSKSIIEQSKYFAHKGYSSINFLTAMGIDTQMATILLALVGVVVIIGIFYIWRDSSLLTLFAVASVIGRVGTYHRFYDNVMLIFLLLGLIEITFNNSQRMNLLFLALVGISLWFPGRIVQIENVGTIVELLQLIVWSISLIYLLVQVKLKPTTIR